MLCCACNAAAGQNIRKLIKDGFVIRKPGVIHSRFRAREMAEAKAKGRHSGYGAHATCCRCYCCCCCCCYCSAACGTPVGLPVADAD